MALEGCYSPRIPGADATHSYRAPADAGNPPPQPSTVTPSTISSSMCFLSLFNPNMGSILIEICKHSRQRPQHYPFHPVRVSLCPFISLFHHLFNLNFVGFSTGSFSLLSLSSSRFFQHIMYMVSSPYRREVVSNLYRRKVAKVAKMANVAKVAALAITSTSTPLSSKLILLIALDVESFLIYDLQVLHRVLRWSMRQRSIPRLL